ncbi:helicase HerA-like domain-containing protein [Polluticoccus soli]|uniref:helicase HerA-like domain-containing protein n=1 Tax=Polluticoccus soli TaxID=3034150 RepID=UPI0023E2E804|nr:helicase HerA-like domain-containing protein [Flavipsychrobacter sp. JY13-12]
MSNVELFTEHIRKGYSFKGNFIALGKPMLDGELIGTTVAAPLKMMNRHGLISGATGTGKTKTLQLLAEGLSDSSVPVLLLDIKGDLSGIGAAGTLNEKIAERIKQLDCDFISSKYPVELLTLSNEPGVKLRATVTEFGPVLLSRILGLNATQESILSMIFKYCDDNKMPLLDLEDLQKTLQWAANEGKKELAAAYGNISAASVGTIMRKVIELQQQGADKFFGERSFEVDDLMRISDDGRGVISIVRVTDLQDKPKLFSTFMLQLLSELYATLPEEGDIEQPKLVMFIDEAHLIFNDASKVLIEQLETVIKLIRSKGVGIFFCTQTPTDIPASILGQLGMKVQHALRAFTANDRKAIVQTAANYPETEYYDTKELITQLGIGEALITLLDEKGIPTPLVHTVMYPPKSRMGVLTKEDISELVSNSPLVAKYEELVNRESAHEILSKKLETAEEEAPARRKTAAAKEEKSVLEELGDNTVVKSMMRTAGNTIVRSLLGSLGIGSRRRKNWF